ncbi:MAG: VOC family protein [Gammaproteobacteria bacterium]|nr:VOC family protein [Gammaproteobacteria bacterium]
MAAQLNHTIIRCHDKTQSSAFLTDMLGLPPARAFMHFMVVDLDNDVSVDFMEKDGDIALQHYAFLVDEAGFDAVMARIRARQLDHWADPARTQPGAINDHWGGRGVYFEDPNGHLLEAITRTYGDEKEL